MSEYLTYTPPEAQIDKAMSQEIELRKDYKGKKDWDHFTPDFVNTHYQEFNVNDLIRQAKEVRQNFEKGRLEQNEGIIEFKQDLPISIAFMGDLHFGSIFCDIDEMMNKFKEIEETPNMYVIFMSNLIDNAIPSQFPSNMLNNSLNPDKQVYGMRQIIENLNNKGKVLGAVTSPCYDGDTEVMVKEIGFIKFRDLLVDEKLKKKAKLATINLETGEWEWQKPFNWIKHHYTGKMYHFHNQKIDFLVTANHNMLYFNKGKKFKFQKVRADQCLTTKPKQFVRSTWNWTGKEPTDILGYDPKLFMRLLGWYISEGSSSNGNIVINQLKTGKYYEEIKQLIIDLGFNVKEYSDRTLSFRNKQLFEYLHPLGRSWEKYIPEEIKELSKPLLMEFLTAYWKGDGHFGNGKNYHKKGEFESASTASKKLADDLVEIIIKCGYAAMYSTWERKPGNLFPNGIRSKTRRTQYNINVCHNIYPHYRNIPDEIDWDDFVYCVSVKNETILVKKNGKIGYNYQCHEGWMHKHTGQDINELIFGFEKRKFPVLENGGKLLLKFPNVEYQGNLYHQTGPFESQFNETHALKQQNRLTLQMKADFIAGAHRHVNAVEQVWEGFGEDKRVVTYIRTGSEKGTKELHDSFTIGKMGKTGEPSGPVLTLFGDHRAMIGNADFETGVLCHEAVLVQDMVKKQK